MQSEKDEASVQMKFINRILANRNNEFGQNFLCTNSVDNFVNKNLRMRLMPLQIKVLPHCLKFELNKTLNNQWVVDFEKDLPGIMKFS